MEEEEEEEEDEDGSDEEEEEEEEEEVRFLPPSRAPFRRVKFPLTRPCFSRRMRASKKSTPLRFSLVLVALVVLKSTTPPQKLWRKHSLSPKTLTTTQTTMSI